MPSATRPIVVRRPRRVAPKIRAAPPEPAGLGPALDGDHVLAGIPGAHVATSTIAVTSTLRVASGSRIFHPKDMSWS